MAHRLYTQKKLVRSAGTRSCVHMETREREKKIVKKYKNKLGPYRYFLHVVFKATRKKLVSICNSSSEKWAGPRLER